MYLVGFAAAWWLGARRIRQAKAPITRKQFDDLIFYAVLGVVLGGRLGYVLFYNWAYFAANPLEAFQLWKGGMSFHGGFLGCVAAVMLFAVRRRVPTLTLGDITCAVGPIGLFFGRIANFINAELWGRQSDVAWAVIFPGAGPLPRHPSQLYQALLEGALLFVVLSLLIRMGALRRPGLIIGAFALGYGIARCIGELFREPDAQLGFISGALTMGMILSLPMVLIGLAAMAVALIRRPA
jgi:phosphatidylglycerol:prolipoprotein diacylglycerol transferase